MKAQTRLMGVVIASLLMPSAFAETATLTKREVTRIDFNKMIDANASDKSDLEKTLVEKQNERPVAQAVDSHNQDKDKVIDFVDVEVNMKKERPIVDRRFNSVGEPRIAPEFSVQLISRK